MSRRRIGILVILLLVVAAAIRVWAAGYARFTGDEAEYWAISRRLATFDAIPAYGLAITGSEAKLPGPLYFYLMAVPQLLGASPWFGTVFVVLLHLMAGSLLFLQARQHLGDTAAIWALALFTFTPWDVLYSDRIWGSCVVPALGTLAIYAAMQGQKRPAWLGVCLAVCLVLPQLHMSAPILWATCATIVLLRAPPEIPWRALGLGLAATVLLYAHPLVLELTRGFPNTRTILARAGGAAPATELLWVPVKVFLYAFFYSTAELGYHFARGYWGGGFDDVAAYFTVAGWQKAFQEHGTWPELGVLSSFALAAAGWGASGLRLAKDLKSRLRERTQLSAESAMNVGLLVGLTVGAGLMVSAKKSYFPHYANILMPMLLWPVAAGLGALWRRHWLRVPTLLVGGLSFLAMTHNVRRYYLDIDRLNGLNNTLAMVSEALDGPQPFALSFEHYNNSFAWGRLSQTLHGRALPVTTNASLAYRVRNAEVHEAREASKDVLFFDGVLLARHARSLARPKQPGIVLRASELFRRARVVSIHPDGSEDQCSAFTGSPPRCQYGQEAWHHFGVEEMLMGGQPRSLLFMHPIAGSTVRATFSLPPEQANSGILFYGLHDDATRSNNRSPVRVRVLQGDEAIATAEASNQPGLHEQRFDLSPGAEELTVEITTDNDGARVFGFDLDLFR